MSESSHPPLISYRSLVLAVVALGVIAAAVSFRMGRAVERDHAEAEFEHRATLRHALTREVLGHYEDALFGLSSLFTLDAAVSRAEFDRTAARFAERIAGIQAFEWVPFVRDEDRAAVEAAAQRQYPERPFEFVDFNAAGGSQRAPSRSHHYPILYIHPFRDNELALGYDLAGGTTQASLEQARTTRHVVVSHQIRLVQEKGNQFGVVMALPIYGAPAPAVAQSGNEDGFRGFLQCVFRVRDLLEKTYSRQPTTMLDMLFIDLAETDPTKRILFYRPADGADRAAVVTESEFRGSLYDEFRLSFGQRDWRVLYRPHEGWLEQQHTSMPVLRSGGILLVSFLLAALIHSLGRRAETIRSVVTERTAELAESRRHLASMLHALPGMAFRCTYDEQLSVLFLSEGAYALTGWTGEQIIGGEIHFRDLIHPDDLARVREATRAALQEHKDVEVEYRICTRSTGEKWVLSRGRGVYSADGTLNVFEGLAIDITAQKQAESARLGLERKLLEGQKLESLGLLAGGIAHDFNNLLSGILGSAGMARHALPPGHEAESQLRAIEAASMRAAELCRQMLAYAGKGRFVIEPADLTALTEDLLPLLKISIAHHALLKLNLARNLPLVMADATQLRQIVMNLVLNAVDAIMAAERSPGEIALTTGLVHADQAMLAGCVAGAGLPRGDYVFLEVRDTGLGMASDVIAKIFDPFFTTKFAGRGLGLAAVLGIVRGHQGALRVESTPGFGSSFRLLLPPARKAVAPAKPASVQPVAGWRGHGKVLIVEDEEPVRIVMVAMLKSFGFEATGKSDGRSAVSAFRADPGAYELVVLDLLMPGMNGEQTFAELRAIRPELRVLLMSGYSEGDILGRLGGGPALAFLAKPFTREVLENKLRQLLG